MARKTLPRKSATAAKTKTTPVELVAMLAEIMNNGDPDLMDDVREAIVLTRSKLPSGKGTSANTSALLGGMVLSLPQLKKLVHVNDTVDVLVEIIEGWIRPDDEDGRRWRHAVDNLKTVSSGLADLLYDDGGVIQFIHEAEKVELIGHAHHALARKDGAA